MCATACHHLSRMYLVFHNWEKSLELAPVRSTYSNPSVTNRTLLIYTAPHWRSPLRARRDHRGRSSYPECARMHQYCFPRETGGWLVLRAQGKLALAKGCDDEAQHYLQESVILFEELDNQLERGRSMLILASLNGNQNGHQNRTELIRSHQDFPTVRCALGSRRSQKVIASR